MAEERPRQRHRNVKTRYGLIRRKGLARLRSHGEIARLLDARDLVRDIAGNAETLLSDLRELHGMLDDLTHGAHVEHSGRPPDELAEDLACQFSDIYEAARAAFIFLDKLSLSLCPDPDEDPAQAVADDALADVEDDDDEEDGDDDYEDDEKDEDI